MTIYEIPNINHCTVEEIGDPVAVYRITANDGYYIHLNNGVEDTVNVWKTCVALPATYDFSIVQIVPASELPEDAEILANKPTTEVM